VTDVQLAAIGGIEAASPGPSDASALNAVADTAADAIVVRMGAGKFAVALESVAEVGRMPVVTRVPGLPAWLAGVANWRGRILPVIDLRSLLGAEATPLDAKARLVVLTDGGIAVGMLVDAVDGTTPMTNVAAFPSLSGVATGSNLLCGQVPREDGPLAVLDVPAVLRLRDGLPRGRRSA
jgi:purine-binding chemotaxis protein CheW